MADQGGYGTNGEGRSRRALPGVGHDPQRGNPESPEGESFDLEELKRATRDLIESNDSKTRMAAGQIVFPLLIQGLELLHSAKTSHGVLLDQHTQKLSDHQAEIDKYKTFVDGWDIRLHRTVKDLLDAQSGKRVDFDEKTTMLHTDFVRIELGGRCPGECGKMLFAHGATKISGEVAELDHINGNSQVNALWNACWLCLKCHDLKTRPASFDGVVKWTNIQANYIRRFAEWGKKRQAELKFTPQR